MRFPALLSQPLDTTAQTLSRLPPVPSSQSVCTIMESKLNSALHRVWEGRLALPQVPPSDLLAYLFALPDKYTYAQRLAAYTAFLVISALLLRSQRHRPFGWARLPPALLLILGNYLMPFLFHWERDLCTIVMVTLVTTWITTFKVLGWVLNRGPLVRKLTTAQFVAVYACPITPTQVSGEVVEQQPPPSESATTDGASSSEADPQAKSKVKEAAAAVGSAYRGGGRLGESGGTSSQNLRNCLTKIVSLAAIAYILANYRTPSLLDTFLSGMGLYCFLGMLMDGPATLATSAIGMGIAPHFDHPFIASTVTSFWNHRWNLTAGNTLRFLVYDTINEGRLVRNPKVSVARKPWRKALAMTAVFATSGLMHEMMHGYFHHSLSWRFFNFFMAQVPIMLAETLIRAQLRKRGKRIPIWLTVPLTVFVVVWTADIFFFGDLRRIGVLQSFVRNVTLNVQAGMKAAAAAAVAAEEWWSAVDVAAPQVAKVE